MEAESCPNTVDGSEFYHLIWLKSKFDCPHASYIWNIFHYSFTIERNQPFMWVNIPYQSHGSYGLGVTNLWRNAIQQKLESWPNDVFFGLVSNFVVSDIRLEIYTKKHPEKKYDHTLLPIMKSVHFR